MDGRQLLKRYDEFKEQAQSYRDHCRHLEQELRVVGPALYRAERRIDQLEERLHKVEAENKVLRLRNEELSGKLDRGRKVPPFFVKGHVPDKRRKTPGRKEGHKASHRPAPAHIDQHIDVPLPRDNQGQASCPECHCQLSEVTAQQRIVEDIIPAQVQVTCYNTFRGYCPGCRRWIESRAPEQPPASDLAPSQIGINALATAALMRVQYRLPYRLISQLLADLPGLNLSAGAVARQIERMGDWLEGEYDRLKIFLRHARAVNMDETGWRVDGHNQWLWALLDERHTLYHVDKSRGQKVVGKLLGEVFGGVLISDFYNAYAALDCRKQKCLVHLLRELRDTAKSNSDFAAGSFRRRLRRLLKELLLLGKSKGKMAKARYQRAGRRLEQRLAELANTHWGEADADRLAGRLKKHLPELTLFLWEAAVPADNNAAERALRPAVVMRKITGGSRSQRGAQATAVLMSVVRTASQQDRPLFATIKTLLSNAWAGKNPGLLTDIFVDSS